MNTEFREPSCLIQISGLVSNMKKLTMAEFNRTFIFAPIKSEFYRGHINIKHDVFRRIYYYLENVLFLMCQNNHSKPSLAY